MSVAVSPTSTRPTHHISLTDGTTTVGLVAVDNSGLPTPLAIQRQPYPKSNIVVNSSAGTLSEQKSPYGEFSRTDFGGGMGMLNGSADSTAYWIARSLWTLGKRLQNSPKLFAIPDGIENICSSKNWTQNNGDRTIINSSYALKFTTDSSIRLNGVKVWAEATSNLRASIYSDNAGVPGTQLVSGSATLMVGMYPYVIYLNEITLTAPTNYYLVLETSGSATFSCGTKSITAGSAVKVGNGYAANAWAGSLNATVQVPEFLLMRTKYKRCIPFQHCGANYIVQVQEDGTTSLLLVGSYTGVPTAATSTTLVDNRTPAPFTADRLIGCMVEIVEGTGKGQYRKITDNDTTSITISSQETWDVIPDATSLYVIKGLDVANEVTGHGLSNVTDVTIDNETIYFARGGSSNVRRAKFAVTSGSYTRTWVDDSTNKADLLYFTYDAEDTGVVWRALNQSSGSSSGSYIGYCCVSKAVSTAWTSGSTPGLSFGTEIFLDTNEVRSLQDMDGKLAVIQDKGIWMVANDVPEKLSIDMSFGTNNQTGRDACLYSPYLIFPYGTGIERLLDTLVEEIRPTQPKQWIGNFTGMCSIPGAIIVGRSGGELRRYHPTSYSGTSSGQMVGYSHVMVYRGGSWHPIAFVGLGENILSVDIQHVAGGENWMYVGTQYHLYAMRFPEEFDLWDDRAFQQAYPWYEREGHLITGWFDCGNIRLNKWFEKMYLHGYGTLNRNSIKVYYQLDTNKDYDDPELLSDWTYLGELAYTEYDKEINVRILGKRIRFLLAFIADNTGAGVGLAPYLDPGYYQPPYLDGYNVEYLARINDADTWTVPTIIADQATNLINEQDTTTASSLLSTLDAWGRDVTPLTMRSTFAPYDNKRVILDRSSVQPTGYDVSAGTAQKREQYRLSLVIREV
jgi:hypothetical protein